MRSLIKIDKVPVKEDALVPKIFKMQTREEAEMMETALWLGYAVMPVDKLRRELDQSIASRMVNRTGEFVYPSAAFSLINEEQQNDEEEVQAGCAYDSNHRSFNTK